MYRRDDDRLPTYHFDSLVRESMAHAVFTRIGGVSHEPFSTLNVGGSVGDDVDAVAENHARIYAHMEQGAASTVSPQQVHGNQVAVVTVKDAGSVIPGTDGLVTSVPGLALLLRFADCQPILLYDPVQHGVGLIHAGWRSIAQAIARRAVETMERELGTRPEDIIAGLGPAIGPCCYTVGDNVASAMGYVLEDWDRALTSDGDRWRLDLSEANRQQLAAAGVRHIEQADLCTACHNREFFSHRADKGHTGRFAVVAYLKAGMESTARVPQKRNMGQSETGEIEEPDSLHPPGLPAFEENPGGS